MINTAICLSVKSTTMTFEEETRSEGMSEEEMIDDAEVDTMIRESIAQVLGDAVFSHGKMDVWVANIIEGALKRLAALAKPFKYVVTCNIQQRIGAGLHVACSTRWSEKSDGKLTVQWENESIFALVTVYWVAL